MSNFGYDAMCDRAIDIVADMDDDFFHTHYPDMDVDSARDVHVDKVFQDLASQYD